MGTIIEAVATAHAHGPFAKGARQLADKAALQCLDRSGCNPDQIDLLINAGVYREDELAEPALASMIQQDIDANPGHPPATGSHGTFSFDVSNGGAGVLTGLQLLDGFLRSETITRGMVVTSDVPPRHAVSYPFNSSGAAVILGSTRGEEGFVDFAFETFDDFEGSYESSIVWHPRKHRVPLLAPGHNEVEVHALPDFARVALDCAERVTAAFLDRHHLAPRDLDWVLTSQYPTGFPAAFAKRLGIEEHRAIHVSDTGTHTAGVLYALDQIFDSGRLFGAKNVLLVTVGAGLTVGAALYRPGS